LCQRTYRSRFSLREEGEVAWPESPNGLGINRQLSINLKIHAEASIG